MNERIENLMVNASSGACYDGNDPVLSGAEIEKFAELIIKETMQVVAHILPSNVYLNVADAVIEQFGVEE